MPTNYNGIGTHYYGKKNILKRPGVCRSCGRKVELTSYDTRLWIVFFFLPIFPLKRKRIVDHCPACTRHYAIDLDKWETARQLEVSGALEQFRSQPTAEGAIAAHQQLLNFHQFEQADEFRKTMLEQFSDHAKVQAYLGGAVAHTGQLDESLNHYQRALALRPDLPEARVGVARGHIRAGRLAEARALLDFLEKPGAAQLYPLEPLETLAYAYQQANQHNEALELFGRLHAELPNIAEHKPFRDAVKRSEKTLDRRDSLLPKQKFSWRRLFQGGPGQAAAGRSLLILGVVLAVIALTMVILNENTRRHRTLHLVNGYKQPLTVTIPGVGVVRNFRGVAEITLPEGSYHASVSGPVQEEMDFEVRDNYFARWFSHPAWVLNPGSAAVLVETSAVYSDPPQPASIQFHFGQRFTKFSGIDHPFTPLPDSVQVESGHTRTLVQLDLFKAEGSDVFRYYIARSQTDTALNFGEQWLRAHPEDTGVLHLYVGTTAQQKQEKRMDAFLGAGISNRPVNIEWHRLYQSFHDHGDGHAALVAHYEGMLQAEPASSALLYLRGRLEPDLTASRDYYERAVRADPKNPYPHFALGADRMSAGDWAGAKRWVGRAVELAPNDRNFLNRLITIRLALGEAADVEQEMRKQLAEDPVNYLKEMHLVNALAAQNHNDAALEACAAFENACRNKMGAASRSLANAMRYHALYVTGDLAGLKNATTNDSSLIGRHMLTAALIELGELADAVKVLPTGTDDEEEDLLYALAQAMAWGRSGNGTEADRWWARAIQQFQSGNGDYLKAAALLTRDAPPSLAEVQDIGLPPRTKSVLLAALSQRHPQARKEFSALARQLSTERLFPFHLVQRVTAETP